MYFTVGILLFFTSSRRFRHAVVHHEIQVLPHSVTYYLSHVGDCHEWKCHSFQRMKLWTCWLSYKVLFFMQNTESNVKINLAIVEMAELVQGLDYRNIFLNHKIVFQLLGNFRLSLLMKSGMLEFEQRQIFVLEDTFSQVKIQSTIASYPTYYR